MATFFARRYMREKVSTRETFIGAGILLLACGIAVAFAVTVRLDRNPLFVVIPEYQRGAMIADEAGAAGEITSQMTNPSRGAEKAEGDVLVQAGRLRHDKKPGQAADQKAGEGIFPATELAEWIVPDNVRRFTPDNLYEKIDGRAPIYVQFGVTGLTFGSFRNTRDAKAYLDVYWFDMGSAENAFGIYKTEAGEPEHKLKIGREGYAAGSSVFFWKGASYVQVIAPAEDKAHAQGAIAVAKAIAGTISDKQGQLWAETLLPSEGRVADTFQYQSNNAFGIDWLRDVFSCDYEAGGQTIKLFIHRAGNDKIAAVLHGKYAEFLGKYGKIVKQDTLPDGLLLMGDTTGMLDVVFTKGRYLGGVYGAKDGTLAEASARAFQQSLPAEAGDPNAKLEETGPLPANQESHSSPPESSSYEQVGGKNGG